MIFLTYQSLLLETDSFSSLFYGEGDIVPTIQIGTLAGWGWITVIFFLGGVGHIFMSHPVLEPFAEGAVAIAIAALCSLKYFTIENEN